jgi:hypothetical protein
MAVVEIISGYSEITSTDIVIPLIETTFPTTNLVYYNDPDAINLDGSGNVKSISPWVGSLNIQPPTTSNAPTVITDGLGNGFWKTDGTTKYLMPSPATGNCPISTANFSTGVSAFWVVKEKDNTFQNRMFQIFGIYFTIYTVSTVRTFEGKKLSTPSNGTVQTTAPTTDTTHVVGFVVDVATNNIKLYVDGVQVATNTSAAWSAYASDSSALAGTTWFGSNGTASSNNSKCEYGAWAIYNAPINSTNVTAIYNTWKSKYGL